jgi:hypothetical protein
VVDNAFPGSKFILTVRDSPEVWYKSITLFHAKLFGRGNIPSEEQLSDANYVRQGWILQAMRLLQPEGEIYQKERLIEVYNKHNTEVMDYFAGRENDFLVLNLRDVDSYERFCDFIEVPKAAAKEFPWKNKTENIKTLS